MIKRIVQLPTKILEVTLVLLTQKHTTILGRLKSYRGELCRGVMPSAVRVLVMWVATSLTYPSPSAIAQNPDGQAASQRLIQERPNDYRGAKSVGSMQAVKQNMRELFEKILISGPGDGKADKWYSPHLRDILSSPDNIAMETRIRGTTAPFDYMILYCMNPFNVPVEAACPLTVNNFWGLGPVCRWHEDEAGVGGGPKSHRPVVSCFSRATTKYLGLTQPSNFKMCCVREGPEEASSSEFVAAMHPLGDGWAGLWEYYYPTLALGWENDRTTSMIVDQGKVQACVEASDKIMNATQDWVTGAINRNLKAVGGLPAATIQKTVQESIGAVRPTDRKLRFTDSLQSEGLTLRVNLAAMDPAQRRATAARFCMRPEQFDKLMDPDHDPLQLGGGPDLVSLDNIPVWSNYCPQGVELMTDPRRSRIENLDGTKTNFIQGMNAWEANPLYCQKMNLSNVNMFITGLGRAALQSPGAPQSQAAVGYTCLEGGKLNGSMVPVELYRHAAVERRTAIADHALGFLIAGGNYGPMTAGKKSFYKRFEPQPYSKDVAPDLQTFIGTRFAGGGVNEVGMNCPPVGGEDYSGSGSKSDRLFISDKTNKAFDQEIVQADDQKGGFNRYREEWGKDPQTAAKIAARGLDKESQNYAAPFRIFATCPKGYKRWKPNPVDAHNEALIANVNQFCREENFGGRSGPIP